ncbi:hypothetical protein, partial [Pseudomonas sp. FEN]
VRSARTVSNKETEHVRPDFPGREPGVFWRDSLVHCRLEQDL